MFSGFSKVANFQSGSRLFRLHKIVASVWVANDSAFGISALPPYRNKITIKVPDSDIHVVGKSGVAQAGTGKIYDKKPFKFRCEKGKSYYWCTCGWSHSQPFCDGTHKNPHMKITMFPVRFIAPETKEYWFCNCKQTSQRPFCDGTHRNPDIQAAIRS